MRIPDTPKPWPCVVLAWDPGETSGFAIFVRGMLKRWGTVDVFHSGDVQELVDDAVRRGITHGLPVVCVIEKAVPVRKTRNNTQGAARPILREAWKRHANSVASKIVMVDVPRWRHRVLGGNWSTATSREIEQRVARMQLQTAAPIAHDAAAAICIGIWAVRAGEVGKVLGQRVRDKHMRSIGRSW